jgi:hypothetical protein
MKEGFMATVASMLGKVAPPGPEVVVFKGRLQQVVRDGRLFEAVARAFAPLQEGRGH